MKNIYNNMKTGRYKNLWIEQSHSFFFKKRNSGQLHMHICTIFKTGRREWRENSERGMRHGMSPPELKSKPRYSGDRGGGDKEIPRAHLPADLT